MKLDKCELCGKDEMQEMLLKFPFEIAYKGTLYTEESAEEDSYRCVKCVMDDLAMWETISALTAITGKDEQFFLDMSDEELFQFQKDILK